jgi:ABC-2 type transport system permease protein
MTILHNLPKYRKTASMAVMSHVGEDPLFLADYFLRFLRVAALLSVWRMILAGRGEVSGLTVGSVLTYTLISEIFSEQLTCRAGLENAIWEGNIVTRFTQPLPPIAIFTFEMLGRWFVGFWLCSLPLLALSPLLGVNPFPASGAAAAWFAVSLVLAIVVSLAIDLLFATVFIVLDINIWVIARLQQAIGTLLSGAMIPLALLPWGLGQVLEYLPFASTASAPLRIYIGKGDPVSQIAVQAIWVAVLWPVVYWSWRRCRERMTGYGG